MTDLTALERLRFNETSIEVDNARSTYPTLGDRLDNFALGGGTLIGKFVSPDGSNSNAGTEAAPYLTLTYALTQVKAGDTIYLMAGATSPYLTSVGTTVNVAGITIAGHPTNPATLTNSANYTGFTVNATYSDVYQKTIAAPVYAVWLNDVDRLTSVASLALCHSTVKSYYYGGGVLYVHSATSPTNVRVNDTTNRVLKVTANSVSLEGLRFEFSTQCMELTGDSLTINDLAVENNSGILITQYVMKFTGDGLVMTNFYIDATGQIGLSTDTTVDNVMLAGGLVEDAGGEGIYIEAGTATLTDITVTGGNEAAFRFRCGGTYDRCTALDFHRFGFYHDNGNTITGYNSIAYQSAAGNLETTECWGFVGDRDTATTDFKVYNCTVANLLRNSMSSTSATQAGFGINCDGVVALVGCVAYKCYKGFAKLPAFTPSSFTHEYNWSNSNTTNYYGYTTNGTEVTTNPLFVDEANDDYKLSATSPCIDALPTGTSYLRADYADAAPDGGRFEYEPFNKPLFIIEENSNKINELFVVWPDGRRTKLAIANIEDVSATMPVVDTLLYLGGYI